MNISPSLLQLREEISEYVVQKYDLDNRHKTVKSSAGFDRNHWQAMVDLGWLKVPFFEKDGGTGGTAIDKMVLMEELGRGLVIEPILPSLILSGELILESCSQSMKEALLPQLISGEITFATGLYEPQSRYDLSNIMTKAEPRRFGYSLSGRKSVVLNGMEADKILVSARTGGGQYSQGGITLLLLDPNMEGITRRPYKNVDGHAAAELIFDSVYVDRRAVVGEPNEAFSYIENAVDTATLALCSEALGAMSVLNKKTVEHCNTRQQFGVALSSFQSLQHRMADMLIEYQLARSAVLVAVSAYDQNNGVAAKQISAAKYRIGVAAKKIAQEAVQLHGATGITDKVIVSHYFKRLTTIESQFGNQDHHLNRYIVLSREEDI